MEEIKYKILDNKNEMSITHYVKIHDLYKEAEKNEMEVNEKQLMSICLDLPLHMIDKLPLSDYNEALNIINTCLTRDSVFVNKFKYKGIEFGFIPSLEDIKAGEYAALDIFFKDISKNALNIINVLYRPITKEKEYKNWWSKKPIIKYEIEDYNPDVDVEFFKDLPYDIFESSMLFFCNLEIHLLNATQNYMKATEVNQTNYQNHSQKNGNGIKHLTHTIKQRIKILRMYNTNLSVKYSLD